jgi:hypothetical protein
MDGFCICSGFTGHLCEGVLPDIIAWRVLSASIGDWETLGH